MVHLLSLPWPAFYLPSPPFHSTLYPFLPPIISPLRIFLWLILVWLSSFIQTLWWFFFFIIVFLSSFKHIFPSSHVSSHPHFIFSTFSYLTVIFTFVSTSSLVSQSPPLHPHALPHQPQASIFSISFCVLPFPHICINSPSPSPPSDPFNPLSTVCLTTTSTVFVASIYTFPVFFPSISVSP